MTRYPRRHLLAGVAATFIGVGVIAAPLIGAPPAAIRLSPTALSTTIDEPFTVNVELTSRIPTNVFQGLLHFDHTILQVESIAYNTSIADLWAEEPWYENGDGTLSFIGGATDPGGFTGDGTLITITFRPIAPGDGAVTIESARVLQHDGLGTDVPLPEPIDALFTVGEAALTERTVLKTSGNATAVAVTPTAPSTDLNGDGRQSIADVSIFMQDLLTQNPRADFNGNGRVDTSDLSILLDAR